MASEPSFAPGMRLLIRDEEWLLRRTKRTPSGGIVLCVVGLSELVRGQERDFLTSLEKKVEVVDPRKTNFSLDNSQNYLYSRLYIEHLLRQTTPTDGKLYVGDQAAADPASYQQEPASVALNALRPRILIADSVGLGKTIECGILLSELIARGRGKRILVLTVKSMLRQFQKELWARFAIPFVRLDSVGVQRVRAKIPASANPFYYYDKAIVSIDTLKREGEYRNYLEEARWDVIAIDEAHNVADRSESQRSRLARLVADRCDSLIMLTATPHDGRRSSFASLMNMLNPTAIADPTSYGRDDVKGLFIRRHKKDVQDELGTKFPDRRVERNVATASEEEERVYDLLSALNFKALDRKRSSKDFLFKTTLEKALFSSPAACAQTLENRLKKVDAALEKERTPDLESDRAQLVELLDALKTIKIEKFSKYQKLVDMLQSKLGGIGWNKDDPNDRLVIFTERVATMEFLKKNLPKDLDLPESAVKTLQGGEDVAVMNATEDFGNEKSPTRLLIATDVASEGVNLHYRCHRLIHFDVPWSLIIFQQRNGRVDRYGQKETPELHYLFVKSGNQKIAGDWRILEKLTEKDKEVVESIGDPSEFMGCDSVEDQEFKVGQAMERGASVDEFVEGLEEGKDLDFDWDSFYDDAESQKSTVEKGTIPSIYRNDYEYVADSFLMNNSLAKERSLNADQEVDFRRDDVEKTIVFTPNDRMRAQMKFMPPEILPEDERARLCADRRAVQASYAESLAQEDAWPKLQLLWRLHPVVSYLGDVAATLVERQFAPTIYLTDRLKQNETLFWISAIVSNRQSQPTIFDWRGYLYRDGEFAESRSVEEWIDRLRLKEPWTNTHVNTALSAGTFQKVDKKVEKFLRPLMNDALDRANAETIAAARKWETQKTDALNDEWKRLEAWRKRSEVVIQETFFSEGVEKSRREQKAKAERSRVEKKFKEFGRWVENSMTIEKSPTLRVAAVFCG